MAGSPVTPAFRGWRVSAQRGIEYEVIKCSGLFDPSNPALLASGSSGPGRRFVVVDENVHRLHAAEIAAYFDENEVEARIVVLPAGEASKTIDGYLRLAAELDAFPVERRDEPVIAIGGGVLTDLAGFLAGTYRRGLPHIRVPTTLVGYVDAAVGLKTGINFNGHKNRLGAFVPPAAVLLDAAFLATLPARHIRNGLGEILKLAVIADLPLFELLEEHGAAASSSHFQDQSSTAILDRSVQRMIDELQPNLFEDELSRSMDFGHTFSYGLETCPEFDLLHGEAVLLDVLISCALSRARGLLGASEMDRILCLVAALELIPAHPPIDADLLWQSLEERTLHRNGRQRIPLPPQIGSCTFVNDVRRDEVLAAVNALLALSAV